MLCVFFSSKGFSGVVACQLRCFGLGHAEGGVSSTKGSSMRGVDNKGSFMLNTKTPKP